MHMPRAIIVICASLTLFVGAAIAQENRSAGPAGRVEPRQSVQAAHPPGSSDSTTSSAPSPSQPARTDRSAKPASAASDGSAPPHTLTAREELARLKERPLSFYVAQGGANACGEGCDTWVAAEGFFDADAADRFRRFFKNPGRRALPIYFHSGGGILSPALEIGKMMRDQNMRAGIAKTVPRECTMSKLSDQGCTELTASGREFAATLDESVGLCASACVYAFAGASTRHVAPAGVLAVHAGRHFVRYGDGRIAAGTTVMQPVRARVRRYLATMGVDPALFDAAEEVSHEQIRVLTREEIVRFKIDTRETSETAWNVYAPPSGFAAASKALFQKWKAGDSEYSEYMERRVIVSCTKTPGTFAFAYTWIPDTRAPETMGVIKLEMGVGWPMALVPAQTRSNARFSWRTQFVGMQRLAEVPSVPDILVAEDGSHGNRQFKVSTAGFSDALAELTKSCPMSR